MVCQSCKRETKTIWGGGVKMAAFDDLSGKEFGIWEVLEFDHMKWNGKNHRHGMSYYKCRCKACGAIRIKDRATLIQGRCSFHHRCEAM